MTVEANIYLAKDSHGNTEMAVCEETCDVIQIATLQAPDGKRVYFESDAYHVFTWAEKHGIEVRHRTQHYSFDELW